MWTSLADLICRLAEQLPALWQYLLMDLDDEGRGGRRVITNCRIGQSMVFQEHVQFITSLFELFSGITGYFSSLVFFNRILYDEMRRLALQLMQRCLTSLVSDLESIYMKWICRGKVRVWKKSIFVMLHDNI